MKQFEPFLRWWRATSVSNREIVEAVVRPEHVGPSEGLQDALKNWPGTHYWVRDAGHDRIVLIRTIGEPAPERWGVHLFLFALTFVTVMMAGAVLAGRPVSFDVFKAGFSSEQFLAMITWVKDLMPGLVFALAFMSMLLVHELGHYFAARRYVIDASPPYFLPAPPMLIIGTLGAFIRIRSPIADRRQLMDVGASGPWAGFVVALACLIVGITNSTVIQLGEPAQVVQLGSVQIPIGDSLLLVWVRHFLKPEGLIALDPLAVAGWFGVFVTALNLLPMGQLDGGHVLYSLIKDKQKYVGWIMWYALLFLGFRFTGWWIWAGLTLLLGRGGLSHPSVLDRYRPLPRSRIPVGWATVFLFIITFTPIPFHLPL